MQHHSNQSSSGVRDPRPRLQVRRPQGIVKITSATTTTSGGSSSGAGGSDSSGKADSDRGGSVDTSSDAVAALEPPSSTSSSTPSASASSGAGADAVSSGAVIDASPPSPTLATIAASSSPASILGGAAVNGTKLGASGGETSTNTPVLTLSSTSSEPDSTGFSGDPPLKSKNLKLILGIVGGIIICVAAILIIYAFIRKRHNARLSRDTSNRKSSNMVCRTNVTGPHDKDSIGLPFNLQRPTSSDFDSLHLGVGVDLIGPRRTMSPATRRDFDHQSVSSSKKDTNSWHASIAGHEAAYSRSSSPTSIASPSSGLAHYADLMRLSVRMPETDSDMEKVLPSPIAGRERIDPGLVSPIDQSPRFDFPMLPTKSQSNKEKRFSSWTVAGEKLQSKRLTMPSPSNVRTSSLLD